MEKINKRSEVDKAEDVAEQTMRRLFLTLIASIGDIHDSVYQHLDTNSQDYKQKDICQDAVELCMPVLTQLRDINKKIRTKYKIMGNSIMISSHLNISK